MMLSRTLWIKRFSTGHPSRPRDEVGASQSDIDSVLTLKIDSRYAEFCCVEKVHARSTENGDVRECCKGTSSADGQRVLG